MSTNGSRPSGASGSSARPATTARISSTRSSRSAPTWAARPTGWPASRSSSAPATAAASTSRGSTSKARAPAPRTVQGLAGRRRPDRRRQEPEVPAGAGAVGRPGQLHPGLIGVRSPSGDHRDGSSQEWMQAVAQPRHRHSKIRWSIRHSVTARDDHGHRGQDHRDAALEERLPPPDADRPAEPRGGDADQLLPAPPPGQRPQAGDRACPTPGAWAERRSSCSSWRW